MSWPWPSLSAILRLFASFPDLGWIKLFPATQLEEACLHEPLLTLSDWLNLPASIAGIASPHCWPKTAAKENQMDGLDWTGPGRDQSIHP